MNTNMSNPSATFLGNIDKNVDAYKNNPHALQKEVQQDAKKPLIQQKLQKLIALEILSDKYKAAENQVALLSDPLTDTVYGQKAKEVFALSEADVLRRVAAVEQNKAAEQRKRLQQLAGQGIPTAYSKAGGSVNKLNMGGLVGEYMRAPTTNAANGGLVSFKNGGGVEKESLRDWLLRQGEETIGEIAEWAEENQGLVIAGGLLTADMLLSRFGRGKPAKEARVRLGTMVGRGIPKAWEKLKNINPKEFVNKFNNWRKSKNKPEVELSLPGGQRIPDAYTTTTGGGIAGRAAEGTLNKWRWPAYGYLGYEALDEFDAPGDDTTKKEEEVVVDPLQAENERLLELLAQMQAGQTSTVSGDRAAIEDAYDETAGAYETGLGSLDTSLQAATDRQKTDAAARAKLQSGLTQEMDAQTEAKMRGITDLRTAQGTAYGEHQDTINQLNTMAGKARGTDKDYLRDLIVGLGTVGQGRNLGQGLGDAGIAIAGRQDERAATARGIEKEALGEEVRLSESRLAGAKDIVGLENALADDKVANQRLLIAEDAETRQLATINQQLINTITTTIADYGVKAKEAEVGKSLALAEQSLREMTIAAQQRQLTTQDIDNLTKLSSSLADTLGNIPMLEGLDEDEKANAQRLLLGRIKSIHDSIEVLVGI